MTNKERIKKIHENTDFKIPFAGVTQLNEFRYINGSKVQPGLDYHVHYTKNKEEVYMLGGAHTASSKIINKIAGVETSFAQYKKIKTLNMQNYPKIIIPIPSQSDYSIGHFKRYFTKKANDQNSNVFETAQDFFTNPSDLFVYMSTNWKISGSIQDVIRFNTVALNRIINTFSSTNFKLDMTEFWAPPVDSQEYLEKKLALRRNQFYQ